MFDPVKYLEGDREQYFTKLQVWKETYKKEDLERCPNLREQIRHKKIYIKPSWVKHYRYFFYFLGILVAFVIVLL